MKKGCGCGCGLFVILLLTLPLFLLFWFVVINPTDSGGVGVPGEDNANGSVVDVIGHHWIGRAIVTTSAGEERVLTNFPPQEGTNLVLPEDVTEDMKVKVAGLTAEFRIGYYVATSAGTFEVVSQDLWQEMKLGKQYTIVLENSKIVKVK